jgi:hypothetical protein
MKPSSSLFLGSAILLASLDPANAADSKPAPTAVAAERRWELQIAGGRLQKLDGTLSAATLRDVVDYLVELHPANVVLAPTLGSTEIENLKLAGFRWESALEALRIASGNQFVWSVQAGPPETDPVTGAPVRVAHRDETDLYVLEPDPAGAHRAAGGMVEVFNLAGYLQGKDPAEVPKALQEVEQILSQSLRQVRESSGFAGSEPAPSIRFHERANLLVVVGTGEQIEVARKIILALPGTTPSQASVGARYGAGMMGGMGMMGGGGGMSGGAVMGGGGFGGGGGYGGGTMDDAMMKRYGLRPATPPQPTPAPAPRQPPAEPGGSGGAGRTPVPNSNAPALPEVAPRVPGR